MNYLKSYAVVLAMIVVLLPFACKTQKPAATGVDCSTVSATYSKDIAPIISANCMPCHSANFSSYDGLKVAVDNGQLENRVLIVKDMPKSRPPLSDQDYKKIQCWLKNGALNN
jgi:hypothetical protein